MNINQAHDRADYVKKLAAKGSEHIASLKAYIEVEFSEHIDILNTSTPCCLYINFYGTPLLFRIEILWREPLEAAIVAYYRTLDVAPAEGLLGVSFEFDRLGNIERSMLTHEFPAYFLQQVFTALDDKATLRP